MASDEALELGIRYRDAFFARDIEAIMALVTPDFVFENVTGGERIEGAEAARAHIGAIFARWPDMGFEEREGGIRAGGRSRGGRVDSPGDTPDTGQALEWDGMDLILIRTAGSAETRSTPPRTRRARSPEAMPQEHDAVVEAANVDQLEVDPDIAGERRRPAAHQHRHQEQLELVHQAGAGSREQPGPARRRSGRGCLLLHPPHRVGVERRARSAYVRSRPAPAATSRPACRRHARSPRSPAWRRPPSTGITSQTAIVSYIRRPYR